MSEIHLLLPICFAKLDLEMKLDSRKERTKLIKLQFIGKRGLGDYL